MNYKIINGNNIDVLKQYPDNHFDSIITDPPYGIDFLGKAWDANTGALETYQECMRVLKPGGHILAFSAARTYHHLAITLEQAGFEIRDQIMWIYSSGFPKSQDIGKQIQKKLGVKKTKKIKTHDIRNNGLLEKKGSVELEQVVATDPEAKEWSGWGTQLKPAHEPICMARKPMKQTIAKNCQEWGVGALNIDACRVSTNDEFGGGRKASSGDFVQGYEHDGWAPGSDLGRFPANVIHDGSDEVVALFPNSSGAGGSIPKTKITGYGEFGGGSSTYTPDQRTPFNSGSGSAARFFYCPKVNRKERHIGFDQLPPVYDRREEGLSSAGIQGIQKLNGEKKTDGGNNHPTVKPVELMKYLIKLVTPNNGKVLDPFCGSGSTGMAAVELGHEFVGCDLDPNYCKIAEARIVAWTKKDPKDELFDELFDIGTDNDEK
jgi:DNA modification methylase